MDQAERHRLPTVYFAREFVDAGGLMSYAAPLTDLCRRAATYVDKILKGAKPGDLPVEQPTKFELVVHPKTAKALGLTIPPSVRGGRIRSSNDLKPRHEFPHQEGHHRVCRPVSASVNCRRRDRSEGPSVKEAFGGSEGIKWINENREPVCSDACGRRPTCLVSRRLLAPSRGFAQPVLEDITSVQVLNQGPAHSVSLALTGRMGSMPPKVLRRLGTGMRSEIERPRATTACPWSRLDTGARPRV